MKKVISLLLLLGLLVTATVSFSSCGKESDPVGGGAQISVYLGGEITDLDPQGNQTSDAALSIIRLIFEPLFSIGQDGELELAGAKSYKIDKAEGKVTIDLRESYWNDRTTLVRASDYVYAWKRLIRPDFENPAAPLLYDVKNAFLIKQGEERLDELGILALDNDTIEITFEEGFTAYELFLRNLANVALSPLNEKLVNNRESYWGKSVTTISSNGPFRVTELDSLEGTFRLDRNPAYHRPADSSAPVDKYVIPSALKTLWNVNLTIEDDEYLASLIDQLAEKTIFYVGDIPQNLREEKKAQAVITDALSTYSYLFNCANPLFAKSTVRKLLSDVLDREAIAAIAVYGKPATGMIPPTVSEGATFNAWKATDPLSTTAAKTVAAARAELDADEDLLALALTDDDGNFVSFGEFNLTYKEGTVNQLIAEYVKSVWDQLGFTVKLDPVNTESRNVKEGDVTLTIYDDVVQQKYASRDYDVLAVDYQMYSTNALAVLATFTATMNGAGMYAAPIVEGDNLTLEQLINNENDPLYTLKGNRMNYVSNGRNEHKMALYDSKILKAYNEKDLNRRNKLLHEAEGILLNEMPAIPLLFNQTAHLVSGDLSGLTVDRFGYVSFTRCEQKDYEKYLTDLPAETTGAELGTLPETEAAPVDETSGNDD